MEWDKNNKILAVVIVVIVVVVAAVGIGLAVNSGNSGDKEKSSATICFSYKSENAYTVTGFTIVNKDSKVIDLTYGGSGIEIPADKTVIKSKESGWKWSSENSMFYKGNEAVKFTVDKGTLKPITDNGYACYELTSYGKDAKIGGTQHEYGLYSELPASGLTQDIAGLYANDAGNRMCLQRNYLYDLV